jgi:hypothetical protein
MRMIVFSGLFAMALIGAVLAAIGMRGSTWVAAEYDSDTARPAAAAPLAKARP